MKTLHSLLAVIFPRSSREFRLRLLKRLLEFAYWIQADVHMTISRHDREALENELELTLRKFEKQPRPVILHSIQRDHLQETLETIMMLSINYLVFEDLAADEVSTDLLRLRQDLLEKSPVPILILPPTGLEEPLPIESLVVPISGERRACNALTHALALSKRTNSPVTLLHVSASGKPCACEVAGLESLGDQVHHEYAELLDKVVSEASPRSDVQERRRVTRFIHLSGDAPAEITRFMRDRDRSLLILEWKGVFMNGHAEILKAILRKVETPVLIVKAAPEPRSKLKVGKELKAA